MRKNIIGNCDHRKYKIKRSHGKNSRGVPVCKLCGKVIKEEMRQNKKSILNEKNRKRQNG